tara:strand:- start:291 stop:1946 length:1656 start_codon:yes stop_codon:yes gene_type:complete
MKTSGKLRCAIYTRKSTDEGLDHDFNSLEAQRESCAAYCMSQTHEGWEALPERYDDGGFSGGSLDRPAMQTLMQDIEKGLIDIVVVYKVDRLTRSLADFAKLVEIFDKHKVSFVSVTQAFNTTTSMGRLTLNVLLSFAQFEREVTAERIRDKFRASKEKGMWMGGRPPLGYDVDHRKLVINEAEADVVREIFETYLEVRSVIKLRHDLKRRKLLSKRWTTQKGKTSGGGDFTRGALYTLLRNPIYIGRIKHKDLVHDGQHQAIIDPDVWNQVQDLLAANGFDHRTKKNAKSPCLLAGLLAHEDGQPFTSRHTKTAGVRTHYYLHPARTLPAYEIDGFVTTELVGLLQRQRELCEIIHIDNPNAMQAVGIRSLEYATELKSRPRRDLIVRAINKIIVAEKRITIEVNKHGLRDLLMPAAEAQFINSTQTDQHHIIARAFQLKRCGNGKKLIIGQIKDDDRPRADPSLVKAIARAHAWFEDLKTGLSYKEIASRCGIDERLVARTIRLAFLAPDITKAILASNEPSGLTSQKLVRISKLPSDWNAQREVLGFI